MSGRGWYFAKSSADLHANELVIPIFGFVFRLPIPTQWIVVYGNADELAPQHYIFDRTEADGSMSDQEKLRKQIATDFPVIDVVKRLYEDEVDLPVADAAAPPVLHLTSDRLRDAINFGPHFLSLSGHGSQNGCCTLNNNMASNANNGYHAFIGWADSCLTNNFEWEDSMSEDLLKNPNGGAVGYIGNTRFSWIGLGDDYQREFFKRLKVTRHLALLNDSRFNLPNNWSSEKWTKFSLNLLGDPEMPVWVGKPKAMKVTHAAEILKAEQNVPVQVKTSANAAINNAVVSFSMGDNWLVSGITDASGVANLHINPSAIGTIEVVVTAQDFVPYFGTINVKENILCKTAVICKADILCKTTIACGAAITCGAAIACKTTIACGAAISCGVAIACGAKIVPCSQKIACNLSISSCMAAIGSGCPAINPDPFNNLADILKASGVDNVNELAKKQNTPKVKKALEQLEPGNRKALTLMLKRIDKE